ncbi:hypothetical protein B4123_1117 [Bacillus paralicheniformis]|uniref:Uncharacterized protein n=1 Tax=Bacillus paralicheniformis TaxID=1648923 RepID=A0ABY3FUN0_9BACI|nr:hypothetical protein B4123_1117 [Bacillus paralicheniformis]TWJ56862.1 hypothetical protein CHCC5023_1107 [Bacillus paralicheniformis]TWJ78677.1 hypothetical protein CHCC20497_2685 [Bacillus paralicheniformis]TWJ80619.1 hypothetical protein CHCC5019_3512 [Bacillus paralicheniformis]TWL36518.1 hypothetical protein CHCC15381_3108 [Bacillus paralicheniformis]
MSRIKVNEGYCTGILHWPFLQCESSAYVPYIDPFVDQLYNLKIKYEEAHE